MILNTHWFCIVRIHDSVTIFKLAVHLQDPLPLDVFGTSNVSKLTQAEFILDICVIIYALFIMVCQTSYFHF